MRPKAAHSLVVADAGFRNHNFAGGYKARQALGAGEIDAEVVEVAVVNANDVHAKGGGAVDLVLSDRLSENVEPKGIC